MLIRCLTVLSLVLCGAINGFGQTIAGQVLDHQNQALPYVVVSLYRIPDSVVVQQLITNDQGRFHFTDLAVASYGIRTAMLGFEPYQTGTLAIGADSLAIELPPIQLRESIHLLQSTTVTVQRPLIELTDHKFIVNVAGSALADNSTVLDLLARLPGVSLDQEGTIFLKGKASVRIYLDGKPLYLSGADLATFLRGMTSNQLERIEMMSNPPAEYDAAGNAGVIHIRSRKNQNLGSNGSLNLSIGQGRLPKHNAGLVFNHRGGAFNFWANYAFTYRRDWTHSTISRFFQQQAQVFEQDLRSEYPNLVHNFRTGVDLELPSRHTLGLLISGNALDYQTFADNRSQFLDQAKIPELRTVTNTLNRVVNQNASVALHYQHQLKPEGATFSIDADYTTFRVRDKQRYESFFEYFNNSSGPLSDKLLGQIGSMIRIVALKSDFQWPISRSSSLEAGLKTSWVNTDNDVVFRDGFNRLDVGKTNHFSYQENINAAYLSLSKTLNHTRLKLGLRTEQTHADGYQVANDSGFIRRYWSFFPNVQLRQTLPNQHELSLSFSRRIDRPNYQDLNPFLFFFDHYTYVVGNSFLQPQWSEILELSYAHPQNIVLSLQYSRTRSVMTRVTQQDDLLKTIFQTILNLSTYRNYGFAINVPYKVATFWQSNTSLNVYRNHYNGLYLNAKLENRLTSLAFTSIHTLNFGKGYSSELNMNYQSRMAYGVFRYVPTGTLSLSMQKSLFHQQGSLRLSVRDVLFTQRRGADILYQNMNIRVRHLVDSRFATLAFNYRFGNQQVGSAKPRQTAAEEERRRT